MPAESRSPIRHTGACNDQRDTTRRIRSAARRISRVSITRSVGTWLTTFLVVLWPGAVACAGWSGEHAITGKIGTMFGVLPR